MGTITTTDKKLPAASASTFEFGKDLADRAGTYDHGRRRRLPNQRRFLCLPHFPERISPRFQRSDFDRRQRSHGTGPNGFERRRIVGTLIVKTRRTIGRYPVPIMQLARICACGKLHDAGNASDLGVIPSIS